MFIPFSILNLQFILSDHKIDKKPNKISFIICNFGKVLLALNSYLGLKIVFEGQVLKKKYEQRVIKYYKSIIKSN